MSVSLSRFRSCSTWTHLRLVIQKTTFSRCLVVASIYPRDLICVSTSPAHISHFVCARSPPCLLLRKQWYVTPGKQPCRSLHACSWSLSAAKQKAVHLTAKRAKKYVTSLTAEEREHIQTALNECAEDEEGSRKPSMRQLRYGANLLDIWQIV